MNNMLWYKKTSFKIIGRPPCLVLCHSWRQRRFFNGANLTFLLELSTDQSYQCERDLLNDLRWEVGRTDFGYPEASVRKRNFTRISLS